MKRYFQQREIKKTLRTSCYNSAKSLVKKHIAEAERIFTMIRSGVLTDEMIKKLVDEFVDSRVKMCEMVRNEEIVFDDSDKQKEMKNRNNALDRILLSPTMRKNYVGMSKWFTETLRLDLALKRST